MLSIVKDIFGEDAYKVSLMNDVEVIAQTNNNGYSCIRENVGYTALSFFKYLKISEDFSETLDSLVTKNVVFMNDGQNMCAYILTEEGQINSCVSIYKNEDHFIMEIYSWDYEKVKEVLKEAECELTEIDLNCVLIEGPNSRQILLDVFDVDLEYISYQNHEYFDCNGDELLIARTGYTGEFGYKVLGNKQQVENFLKKLAEEKVDCFGGLDAIKQCMVEVKQPDFELSYTKFSSNVFELDYQWFIDFKKDSDYLGKNALYEKVASVIKKNTICALCNTSVKVGQAVHTGGEVIGQVIDCQYSKTLGKYIVVLFIDKKYAQSGFEYSVNGEAVNTVSAPYILPKSWTVGKEDN